MVVAIAHGALAACARAETRGLLRVDLELRSGGALSGTVVDHSPHGLVILADDK